MWAVIAWENKIQIIDSMNESAIAFTCHHTDSTIQEKIQDSIFSKAVNSVLVSRQSSGSCMILGLACLPLVLVFHLTGSKFLSSFFVLPFVQKAFITGLDCREVPKVCAMISLSTAVFDSQNVNLHQNVSYYLNLNLKELMLMIITRN